MSYSNTEVAWGSLGRGKEQQNERAPTHIGKLTFKRDVRSGDILYLSAWVKTGDDGRQYFSIQAQEPREPVRHSAPQRQEPASGSTRGRVEYDDDIPF